MSKIKALLKKSLCMVISFGMVVQPIQAATYQYNVFVKGFRGPGGSGDGEVIVDPNNPNQNQPGTDAPSLTLQSSWLYFDATADESTGKTVALRKVGLSRIGAVETSTTAATPATPPQTTVLTNNGKGPAVISGINSTEYFDVTHDCGYEIPAGGSCSITAQYIGPSEMNKAQQRDYITIRTVGSPGVQLWLVADLPYANRAILSFDQTGLNFGTLDEGVSATLSAVLKNTGKQPASLSGLTSGENFTVSDNCGGTLQPGTSCTITASVTGGAAGTPAYNQVLRVPYSSDAAVLSLNAQMAKSAKNGPALVVTPPILEWEPSVSDVKTAVITNEGNAPGTLTAPLSDRNFNITSDCGTSLEPGATCTISGSIKEALPGHHEHHLPVGVAANSGNTELVLTSYFPAPAEHSPKLKFSAKTLPFTGLSVGDSANGQATLTNEGDAPANIASFGFDPGTSALSQSNNCENSLQPGDSCLVSFAFKAQSVGQSTAKFVISDQSGLQTSLDIPWAVIGAVLSASATVDFGTVSAYGKTATRPVVLTNKGAKGLYGIRVTGVTGPFTIAKNDCQDDLAASKSCTLSVVFTPSGSGDFNGELTAVSANGGEVSVKLSGKGTLARVVAEPTILTFPDMAVGRSSDIQTLRLTNSGADDAKVTGVSSVGDFGQSNNCGNVIPAGGSCLVNVMFTPTVEGVRDGSVAVSLNSLDPVTFTLLGSAFTQKLVIAPAPAKFENTNLGSTSAVKVIEVSNPSIVAAQLTGISITDGMDEFGQSNNCGVSLEPGASCLVSIQAKPLLEGPRTGMVSILSSFGKNSSNLSVVGVAPLGEVDVGDDTGTGGSGGGTGGTSSGGIVFNDTSVSQTSTSRTVTFRNKGTGPLSILGISISNNPAEFSQSNNCGTVIAPGGYCTLTLSFTPSAAGSREGALMIASSEKTYNIKLSGMGLDPRGYWTYLTSPNFGINLPGTPSERTFKFVNTSASSMTIASSLVGDGLSFVLNNCGTDAAPATIPANGYCGATVRFVADAPVELTNAMIVASSPALSKPITRQLTGAVSGYELTFNDSQAKFGKLRAGASISRWVSLKNTSKLSDTLANTVELSGAAFSATYNYCTAGRVLSAGSSCSMLIKMTAPLSSTDSETPLTASLTGVSSHGAKASQILSGSYDMSGPVLEWRDPSAKDGDFGELKAPATAVKQFNLYNNSGASQVLSETAYIEGDNFTITSSSCRINATIGPGSSCVVYARVTVDATTEPGDYAFSATLKASSKSGEHAEQGLLAQYSQQNNSLTWEDSTSANAGDWGTVKAPSSTIHSLRLRNYSQVPMTLASTITLAGEGFTVSYNGCTKGTSIGAGGACTVQVTATVLANTEPGEHLLSGLVHAENTLGMVAELPLAARYVQEAYAMIFIDNTAGSDGAWGTLKAPASVIHSFVLKNASQSTIKLAETVTVSGDGFSINYNGCTKGTSIGAGGGCTVQVTATVLANTAPGLHELAGTLSAQNTMGEVAEKALSGSYSQEEYSMTFVDNTGGDGNWGTLKAPASVIHSFVLKNTSLSAIKLAETATVAGDGFKINYNGCTKGTSIGAGGACTVQVTVTVLADTSPGLHELSGTLWAQNAMGVTIEKVLTANYTQEEYSMVFVDNTAGDGAWGTLKAPASVIHSLVLRNTSLSAVKLAETVTVIGEGFSINYNGCTKGTSIGAGGACTVQVTATVKANTPAGQYNLEGELSVSNTMNVRVSKSLSANYVQEAYTMQVEDASGGGSWGALKAGTSVTHSVRIKNTSLSTVVLAESAYVTGDGFSITYNGCSKGTSIGAGGACTISLAAKLPANSPSGSGISGQVQVSNTMGYSAELPLSASAQ